MGILYHGSKVHNMKVIEPRESTHGNYVYATPVKALAIHFSKRCGDDLTYDIGHYTSKEGPWELVEKIPGAFEKMYSNDSSLYTISDDTFKDINTGFEEVVSEEPVDVISEEYYESVFDAIVKLEKEGLIKIYRYPNKPEGRPKDNSDIIDKWRFYKEKLGRTHDKYKFDRLFGLHPELMDKINELVLEFGLDFQYKEEDLIDILKRRVELQLHDLNHEQYIECSVTYISEVFPDLADEVAKIYENYKSRIKENNLTK